ncbi:MAG: polyphosphate kinase 1 [Anaerolineae bacterium]|jgi:polyphosphate kinase|nr:MAG: polyphosphate kinase 1 [Anaerolineae bacterium]
MSEALVLKPEVYINRELSLLEFQRRVLEEAANADYPILERVKFLSIFGSNMDEFFMVRVSGIREQVELQVIEVLPDGYTPRELLLAIRKRSLELYRNAQRLYRKELLPQLNEYGIHILDYSKLTDAQRRRADEYFHNVVFPILTPLAFDPGHPFPHISNLSTNLAVVIHDKKGREKFARVKVPNLLPALLAVGRHTVKGSSTRNSIKHYYYIWLDQLIAAQLNQLFTGLEVIEVHPFRIVRDADIEIQELEADDLLETMKENLLSRKFGSVVMMAIDGDMPKNIRELLVENLECKPTDVYAIGQPLALSSLRQLYDEVEAPELKFPPYKPHLPKRLLHIHQNTLIFERIREGSILLHHPYDSFVPVIEFLQTAARDPSVLAIKQTLYRVGKNSPVVEALIEAAQNGKQVAVLVELKARFDEESNIEWAQRLEQVGAHVVYGLLGLKTHCKVAMVIRQEREGIRRYLHLATGNYNAITAQIYEDIGLLTCDGSMGMDATDLFNYLTGYSTKQEYRKFLVSPVNLRQKMEALVEREIQHAKNGKAAHLIFKMNSLADPHIVQMLYQASHAGVKIDLIVRSICSLVPGVKGYSENIRVISILGRFLEHSRIYYFHNDGKEEIYIGSADLMTRNLDHRVEVLFPIEDTHHHSYLRKVLEMYLHDDSCARKMEKDGSYVSLRAKDGKSCLNIQEWLMEPANRK